MTTRILAQFILKSPKSVLLLGPRQTGKTTLMKSLKPDISINLADETEYRSFVLNTDELRQRLSLISHTRKRIVVFIDEIQRWPSLLNSIQSIIDEDKLKYKFLLTGSSARKLKRGSANLLPGRIFSFQMNGLSLEDLQYKLDTQKALEIGCLPEPYFLDEKKYAQKLLETYSATYLKEEILAESLVRDLSGFTNFLSIAAENSGQFLDFSKLSTKAKVHRSAARRYYEILEDTLLFHRLDSFIHNDDNFQKKMIKHSKFYLFDVGVRNGVLGNFKASQDRVGFLFEHLFFNQIKNIEASLDIKIPVFHFRTLTGQEIDFIFTVNNKNYLVELKTSEPDMNDIKKLENINQEFNLKGNMFIACIKCKPKKVNMVKVMPWQDIVKEIVSQIKEI